MKDLTKIPLTGSDYFHILLDKHMRKFLPVGNIGRLAVKVVGKISKSQLLERINEEEIFNYIKLVNYRKTFLFSMPCWVLKQRKELEIFEYNLDAVNELPEEIFKRDISIFKSPLIHFDLVSAGSYTFVILSWHHALMDAHGAEMLMKIVSGKINKPDFANLLPGAVLEKKIVEQLNIAKEAKKFILSATPKNLTSLIRGKPKKNPALNYRIIDFSQEENLSIEGRSKALGLRFGLSPLYLAATARAIFQILKKRNSFSGEFWIPVPQDQRLRGAFGPIISNHVSFLFYKLSENNLSTLKVAIDSLTTQMVQQIKEGTTKTYATMMGLFRRLPISLYSSLVKGPTKGAISSFFFSDTGDSLKDFDSFLSQPIEDAIHFPPNIYPPGLTVVFMRVNGKLKVVIGYSETNIDQDEAILLEGNIRNELLND